MRTIALAVLALGSLAACGPTEPRLVASVETTVYERVVYAGSNWYGHAPAWVGVKKGIFREAGFDVEITAFGGSTARVSALEQNDAQFASLGEVAMLTAMSADREGFYWIGNQDIAPGAEGLVAINIDRIEDLRGKSIAVDLDSSVQITVYELLKGAGLTMDDVTILNGTDGEIVDLVRSGDAQAGIIWEPFYSHLRGLDGATVLGTDEDTSIYKRFKTMTGPDVICASRTWFDEDPDRAKRFFRAYFEAVAWCKEHPDELVTLIAEHVDEEPEKVNVVLGNFQWLDWEDQRVVMSDAMLFGQAEYAAGVLLDMGSIKKVPTFRNWTRLELFAD